ncbi:hypothetical protein AM1_5532 [Acaryochloris marina MBIC11017]|uniref:Uncharacterized protein n=1 Tax=Acaryochloris marina (strain MBIC 11017) TaxID=329726 RepID=B0CE12_ACAM1|nr:hypothetical protein AM1_5532 [Acaryochloris marina MBIC11017]
MKTLIKFDFQDSQQVIKPISSNLKPHLSHNGKKKSLSLEFKFIVKPWNYYH